MKLQLTGCQIFYQDQGQGPPVLLIHGYPLNSQMWQPQLKGLSDCARIITPDLRGHGDSDPISGPYPMELLASDCCALIEHLDITQKLIVCGLSMGGYIALEFYRLFPTKVAGLILASTRAAEDSPAARIARDESMALARQAGVRPIVEGMLPRLLSEKTFTSDPELIQWLTHLMLRTSVQGILGALQGMKDRPDSIPFLAMLRIPVLVIHGEEDRIVPMSEARAMANSIPRGELVTIPSAAHLPNLEQAELFNQAVRSFISKVSL